MGQNTIRRNFFLCFLAMFVVWMTGCGKNEAQDPLNTTVETPLSTYRFTENHEVSGLKVGSVFFQTMKKTEEGFSVLYVDSQGNLFESRTADRGATWKEQAVTVDCVDRESWTISKSDMNAAGEYAVLIMLMKEDYEFDGFQLMFLGKNDSRQIAEYDYGIYKVCFNGRILVLTEEGIVEEGNHQQLLEKKGIYSHFYEMADRLK